MNGYIILNSNLKYLTGGMGWMSCDRPEDARVFSDRQIKVIRSMMNNWVLIPVYKQKARWDGKTVTILGDLEPF